MAARVHFETVATGGGGGSGTVTNVSALTIGTTGTNLSSTVVNSTTTPVITLNVPTASAVNRGALSSADWSTFNGKQALLISGTNIKTINGTSLLGSGDLSISASPSGVAGSVQFSDGTNFASDAANFFWDDTNNRLGIGTNAPSASLQIQGDGTNDIARFFNADPIKTVFISNRGEIGAKSEFAGDGGFVGYNGNFGVQVFALKRNSVAGLAVQSLSNIGFSVNGANSVSSYEMELTDTGNLIIGGSSGTARLAVKGSSTTASTTALLVQNSAGTQSFKVADSGSVQIGLTSGINWSFNSNILSSSQYAYIAGSNASILTNGNFSGGVRGNDNGGKVSDSGISTAQVASAVLEVSSTTKGFLPPRMTTTQKNAIATPAAGLVVYDSTTNKLACYNGTTWNDLF